MDAALVSAAVALVVAMVTSLTTVRLQKERLRLELRTQFMAEEAIVHLLEHREWTLRTFTQIQSRIGGFDDDALRQLLVRAGAVRFRGNAGEELWGLRKRNLDRLG